MRGRQQEQAQGADSVTDLMTGGYEAGSTGVATWMKWFVASPDA